MTGYVSSNTNKMHKHQLPCVIIILFGLSGLDGKLTEDASLSTPTPPHIIFIIADDLGWNDVGFHGSNQIPTPNIDALAYNGLILNNYYVTPICTPSRSALMTGKYPIHTGMQHRVVYGAEPRGLPLSETLLPQHLQKLGYSTHIVGKWHLGSFKRAYTPTFRGFESHIGFWTGHHDYFDHTAVEKNYWGLDMRRGLSAAWDLHGQYSTRLFTKESERIIAGYNSTKPLFLYIAHAAVHSGNPYNPLPAPDDTVSKFTNIDNFNRRKYAAMVSELDESVGRIVDALKKKNMLHNSIIVFTTDNGGPAEGFNLNAASNWPLRGTKYTLWEGGVRGAGLLWSTRIKSPGRVSQQMMHISDWLPTLYSAAGGDPRDLGTSLDGVSLWHSLVNNFPSERQQILHNIDDIDRTYALRLNEWKIIKGTSYDGDWDGWYGPSGKGDEYKYDIGQVLGSRANRAVSTVMQTVTPSALMTIRASAVVDCGGKNESSCNPREGPCLFNIVSDPCEKENLAYRHPTILNLLDELVLAINKTAIPASNLPWDERGNPARWSNTWTNFGDYISHANEI